MAQIGLYFGSFNPVHLGHLQIAQHFLEHAHLEEVWFVISPQNPLKKSQDLWPYATRLALLKEALKDQTHFLINQIEWQRPAPHYTIDTLGILKEKYPQHSFSILVGSDNLEQLTQWKDYDALLEQCPIFVYPRGTQIHSPLSKHPNIHVVEASLLPISATAIREKIKEGKSVAKLMPPGCWEWLQNQG